MKITLGSNATCSDFEEDSVLCYCGDAYSYRLPKIDIPAFDLFLGFASLVFAIFLLTKARRTFKLLRESESVTMTTYYIFLWIVCIFNILRFVIVSVVPEPKLFYELLYNMMNAILLFVEISVIIFMSHGYMVSGREAISRTIKICGLIATIFLGIECGITFGLHISLFEQEDWQASLFWLLLSVILSIGYATILILPNTRFRERLPARPLFYQYSQFMLVLQLLRAVGSLLNFFGIFIGFCFLMLWLLVYYALYGPLLYWGFLKDFLRDVALSEYYSEMVINGYFDSNT